MRGQNNRNGARSFGKTVLAGLFGLGLAAGGAALVSAAEGPDIYNTIREFSQPRRSAPAPVAVRPQAPLPQLFRAPPRELPRSALGYAPVDRGFAPLPRAGAAQPLREFPRGALNPERNPESGDRRAAVRKEARRKLHARSDSYEGQGMASATNYCVRLCDGYAFPVGAASANFAMQEVACRAACPGAETLLLSAPAGAKDFDALRRGGATYTALPNAFRYREKFDNACTCRAAGATASPNAVLGDITLRVGDLYMSKAGMRHFNGGARLPYKPRNFSDAVAKLTSKREIAIVRGMEVASLRGEMSPKAPEYLRARVAYDYRQSETRAREEVARRKPMANLGRGFQELKAREARGNTVLRTVQRKAGMVALN